MSVPGQYPNAPDRGQFSLDEFKPVECSSCGEVKRKTVAWSERRVHRFKRTIAAEVSRAAAFCLGCDRQLDQNGDPVSPEDEGFLSLQMREKLK